MVFRTCVWFPVVLRGRPETSACSSAGEPTTSKPWRPRMSSSPIVAALGGAECLAHELLRRNLCVRVLADPGQLVPVEAAVESHAEPAAVADVGRDEEPLRLGLDEHLLHAV